MNYHKISLKKRQPIKLTNYKESV